MNWLVTKNNNAVELSSIPLLNISDWRAECVARCREGLRVVAFFGTRDKDTVRLYCVLADDAVGSLYISSADTDTHGKYPAITKDIPAFQLFERELYEDFGILPEGHPWLKPVRYGKDRADKTRTMENYPFFAMTGNEVHEVAVGPVHAGIIEPGHFRFMCHGEDLFHLEIQLGYQHRGVEALFLRDDLRDKICLAESIAGDSVLAHGLAYVQAVEALSGGTVPVTAQYVRAIALELERVAIHIGDLGAIANDIAYLLGNAVYGATRTLVINTLLALCGSRFGRGLLCPGGVHYGIEPELRDAMKKTLRKVLADVERMSETMFSAASVLSRLERTGIVTKEQALQLGLVGPSGRASGLPIDIRVDHPFGIYRDVPVKKIVQKHGDVQARAKLRYQEVQESVRFILEQLDKTPESNALSVPVTAPAGNKLVVSMTEGWRGETVHVAVTGADGRFRRYKIIDPSFHNWPGLALAVRNNGISDFPLCNKSFNLSYCGHDL
jgi:Ni,Fe-hydrogenase III large subunit